MPEKQNSKKMDTTEAWKLIKQAATLGYEQGTEKAYLRDAYRVIIASRIRAERIAANLTQEEVSNKINTNPLTYRGYENCKSDIPIFYLVRIADLFQVSIDYLTGRVDTKSIPDQTLENRVKRLEEAIGQQNK